MNKNRMRGYVIDAILFVIFSVIAFAAPFNRTTVFWIAYIFAAIAIVAQIYFFRISFEKGEDVKSKFYGFPIAKIGVIYMGIQLILSLLEMIAAGSLPTWVAIILNVLPVGFAAIGCIAADVMRDEIKRQDVQIKKDVSNMRGLQSLTASLSGLTPDAAMKKELQELADEFKYSDPVSSEGTTEIEADLKNLVSEIQKSLIDGDLASAKGLITRVKSQLAERNRICKLGK